MNISMFLYINWFAIVTYWASSEPTEEDRSDSDQRIDRIEALLQEQTKRIQNLEHTISELKYSERLCKEEISYLKGITFKFQKMSRPRSASSGNSEIKRSDVEPGLQSENSEKRLLLGTQPDIPETPIAFYAYMNNGSQNPGPQEILVFDTVKTNQNGGYNGNTGIFTVPVDGIYVFSYSIRLVCTNSGGTELIRNAVVEGATFMLHHATNECDQDHHTGLVVVSANMGDKVYVRTHSTHPRNGIIGSDGYGRSSFSGWRLGTY